MRFHRAGVSSCIRQHGFWHTCTSFWSISTCIWGCANQRWFIWGSNPIVAIWQHHHHDSRCAALLCCHCDLKCQSHICLSPVLSLLQLLEVVDLVLLDQHPHSGQQAAPQHLVPLALLPLGPVLLGAEASELLQLQLLLVHLEAARLAALGQLQHLPVSLEPPRPHQRLEAHSLLLLGRHQTPPFRLRIPQDLAQLLLLLSAKHLVLQVSPHRVAVSVANKTCCHMCIHTAGLWLSTSTQVAQS